MSDPLRVLVLNQRDPLHPNAGGAELHVHEIFRRLAARGYRVTQLVSQGRGTAEHEVLDGIEIRRLGRIRFYYPRVAWACARETRAGRYDVVVECLNKVRDYRLCACARERRGGSSPGRRRKTAPIGG